MLSKIKNLKNVQVLNKKGLSNCFGGAGNVTCSFSDGSYWSANYDSNLHYNMAISNCTVNGGCTDSEYHLGSVSSGSGGAE